MATGTRDAGPGGRSDPGPPEQTGPTPVATDGGRHVTVGGVRLYCEVRGTGPAVLGIHGSPSSALLWTDAAARLARSARCIVYDRRGFGRSALDPAPVTLDLDEHVADAAGLLDALDAAPAVVVGRSTGGMIALELARRSPRHVRALVLLEPAATGVDEEAAAWAAAFRRRALEAAGDDPAALAEFVIREVLGDAAWEGLPEALRSLFRQLGPAALAEMRGRGLDLSEEPLRLDDPDLAGIDVPTLLVVAEDSPEVLHRVADRLVAGLPRAELVHVPGGHLIDPAHPVVEDFLQRVLGAPVG